MSRKAYCYFCQADLGDMYGGNHWCRSCPIVHDVKSTITTYDRYFDSKPKFAHIYTHNDFHVRLHLQENYTSIVIPGTDFPSGFTFEGITITPANVKEKLKLYMLFS